MKNIILTVTAILLLNILYCSANEEEEKQKEPVCNPPALEIKNVSEYIIKRLYIHDTFDYSSSVSVLTEPMNPADASTLSVNILMADQDNKYITFIRDLTTTSGPEIAVTTSRPILFENCYKYTLILLEEDFKLTTSDNFAAEKNLFSNQADSGFLNTRKISGYRK
jgi:hypothetical protein